jgi:hypothetical protein
MLLPELVYYRPGLFCYRYPLYVHLVVPADLVRVTPCLAGVTDSGSISCLEKSQRILVIRHQNILGMAIMTQHHLVVFTTDTGFLIPAK